MARQKNNMIMRSTRGMVGKQIVMAKIDYEQSLTILILSQFALDQLKT